MLLRLRIAVHAVSHSSTFAVKAEARVTVLDRLFHVAFPMLVGSGDFATLIVSPGAILAAVAPEVIVFQASAQVDPSFESFPRPGQGKMSSWTSAFAFTHRSSPGVSINNPSAVFSRFVNPEINAAGNRITRNRIVVNNRRAGLARWIRRKLSRIHLPIWFQPCPWYRFQ